MVFNAGTFLFPVPAHLLLLVNFRLLSSLLPFWFYFLSRKCISFRTSLCRFTTNKRIEPASSREVPKVGDFYYWMKEILTPPTLKRTKEINLYLQDSRIIKDIPKGESWRKLYRLLHFPRQEKQEGNA